MMSMEVLRQRWQQPEYVAAQLAVLINNPVLPGDTNITTSPRASFEHWPNKGTALRVLGLPLVMAATARRGWGCKWCYARRFAQVKGLRPVEPSRASRLLLGPECTHYATAAVDARKQYIRQLGIELRARSRSRAMVNAIVASADVIERDRLGRPVRLRGRGDGRPPLPEGPRLATLDPSCGCSMEVHDVLQDEFATARKVDVWLEDDRRWNFRRVR